MALEPEREFHFETGRPLAERLGYPSEDLDRIPAGAIESFAGVGYFHDLAAIKAVGRAHDATVNDVLLTIIAGYSLYYAPLPESLQDEGAAAAESIGA